ncbi:tyrosine-type recombinase/integrase [Alkalimonas sp. MEB108]|uniref:Tyrosine-type recombinase/integrase n=1 Tax=Alkalimonas cellulosilytica TaxID=3058395 RepID=A0ABU7J2E6_9GAMM|nr:tyrosine-type recombinase/integrase [Alkalimonas sp. MEB108]MEE2000185.1 tyrosine-type recombinase/integrase [Alkalimonas sp. MEB108]
MATNKLTAKQVEHAKPSSKVYTLGDGEGLILRVKPTGIRTWVFNYTKPIEKTRSNLTIGNYPSVSLEDARRKAEEFRRLIEAGKDPYFEQQQTELAERVKAAQTLRAVAKSWHEKKAKTVSDDYALDISRSLELHILPKLGDYPISSITAPMAIEAIRPLEVKGNLETIRRLCQRLNEIMTFATNTGLAPHNPLAGIAVAFDKPKAKNQLTIDPQELPDLMRTLQRASIKFQTRCLIEFQLHTMLRPAEAATVKWEQIDLYGKVMTVGVKTVGRGKDEQRQHQVPLSIQVVNLLLEMKKVTGHCEYVFTGDRDKSVHTNTQTANMALKRMGYKGKLVSHGLRSVASTYLNDQGHDPDLIEVALSHVDKNSVRRAYNRAQYLERRRPLMQAWSDYIEQCATGSVGIASSNVTPFSRAAEG